MIRAFLLFQAIGFGAFGLYCSVNPEVMMNALGAPTMSSDGIYELRGIYGGVSIGAAILYLAGFFKSDMQRPALYFVLAYTGGYALARIVALPIDGFPSGLFPIFVAYEITSAAIAIYLLRRTT